MTDEEIKIEALKKLDVLKAAILRDKIKPLQIDVDMDVGRNYKDVLGYTGNFNVKFKFFKK